MVTPISHGIQLPKLWMAFTSLVLCSWLGSWKQSTGNALTVLLNNVKLNSRHPTTCSLWSSSTLTLEVTFKNLVHIAPTLDMEPRHTVGGCSAVNKKRLRYYCHSTNEYMYNLPRVDENLFLRLFFVNCKGILMLISYQKRRNSTNR